MNRLHAWGRDCVFPVPAARCAVPSTRPPLPTASTDVRQPAPSSLLLTACLGLSLLAGTLLSTGCGNASRPAADGTVTLTFWHSFVSSSIPALEALIDRFETEHPGIRIDAQYIPTGDALVQKLITSVRSGNAPDISWVRAHYMEDLVAADAVYSMDHFRDRPDGLTQEELDDLYPALVQYSSWRGTMYALPMEATNLGLLYNKEHFREVGLDPERPPQTWDELKQAATRLTQDRNNDGRPERVGFIVPAVPATGPQGAYMMWQWIPFVWQAGGYLINEPQTEVIFHHPPGVAALTLWKDLYDAQNLRSFSTQDPLTSFVSGQASMMLDGPWNLPRYDELMPDTDWGIAMLPEGPDKRATVVAGEYLSIFKQTEHPDEAWTFLKWMIQPETQAFWTMESGYLPVRASVMENPDLQQYLATHEGHRAFVEQMEFALAQRPMDFHTVEIQRLIAEAIEQALVGGQDPATVLNAAAKRSNALLASVPAERRTAPATAAVE